MKEKVGVFTATGPVTFEVQQNLNDTWEPYLHPPSRERAVR